MRCETERFMRLVAWPLFPVLLFATADARPAEVAVHVVRAGDALHVEASAEFRGTIPRTWEVLTGYERYAEFIPDMQRSRVVSRIGNHVEVQQNGHARLLFLGFPIDVRLSVTEYPPERIVSRATGGNFREMLGTYRLEDEKGRVRLVYTGRLVPDFAVPPVLGTLVFKHNIETTFRALVEEIERQQAPAMPPKSD